MSVATYIPVLAWCPDCEWDTVQLPNGHCQTCGSTGAWTKGRQPITLKSEVPEELKAENEMLYGE